MKLSKKLSLTWIKYASQTLSLFIFIYIFSAHFIRLIWPTEVFIEKKVFDPSYLRLLISLALLLNFISWFILFLERKLRFISPLSLNLEEKTFVGLTAFFLTVFYNNIFNFLKIFQYPIFVLLFLLLFLFIPQIINSYLFIKYDKFFSLLKETFDYRKEIFAYFKRIVFNSLQKTIIVVFILFSLSVLVLSYIVLTDMAKDYFQAKTYKENQYKTKFYVRKIVPQLTTYDQEVDLIGYNFGSRANQDKRYKLMSTNGEINLIELWTDEDIKFRIPLNLQPGRKKIWIEKPTDNPQNKYIIKSNSISLSIVSRFVLYPNLGDSRVVRILKRIRRILFFKIKVFNNFIFTAYQ